MASTDRPPWADSVADLVPLEEWRRDGDAWFADAAKARVIAYHDEAWSVCATDRGDGAMVDGATDPRAALLALDVATDPDHPAHELGRLRRLWTAVTGEPAPRLIVCVDGWWMRAADESVAPSVHGGWGWFRPRKVGPCHRHIAWGGECRPTIAEQMRALGLPGVPDAS